VAGFARAVPLADIRAKDGNLSIPLYVASAPTTEEAHAGYAVGGNGGLDKALTDWLECSGKVRHAVTALLSGPSKGP